MKQNIYMIVQYEGTRYSGWQRQNNTGNTIENKLNTCLNEMTGNKQDIMVIGSGRTDAGVHANGQTFNFHIETEKTPQEIQYYLNKYLPEDIRIINAKGVNERFHSRLNATAKTYIYRIDNGDKADVFYRKFSWHIDEKLDIDQMKSAADCLIGIKDYISFSDMKNDKKSTIREIYDINITKDNDIILIKFYGNGFLYHMVRKLTAAIVLAGKGELDKRRIMSILMEKNRQAFKEIAPAKGLILDSVEYDEFTL